MDRYDHSRHAGNAGDVWKHLILAEVAESLISRRAGLVYVESHAGYPEYFLKKPGEWTAGIGRCWSRLTGLTSFSYFRILADLNPSDLKVYPGSTGLVLSLAKKSGLRLTADIWDTSAEVSASWKNVPGIRFHLGDGFSGARPLIDKSCPGLLFIDPPYLDGDDLSKAIGLLEAAGNAGWIVVWWQMMMAAESVLYPDEPVLKLRSYPLNFFDAGLDCGRWRRAVMTVAGADEWLANHLDASSKNFIRVMSPSQHF